MTGRRFVGDIGVADVATAMATLGADSLVVRRIAALCGFDLRPDTVPAQRDTEGASKPPPSTEAGKGLVTRPPVVSASSAEDEGSQQEPAKPWRRYLKPIGREYSETVARADPEPLPPDSPTRAPLDLHPLLLPRYTARAVQSSASADAGDGDIDTDEVVEILAERRPLTEWPLQRRLSMLRGLQLLVDVGESMSPFARDCADLAEVFIATVGNHLVQQLAFSGCPLESAGIGPRRTWRPYVPPPPGTPVVALSDLNIPGRGGRGVDVDGWLGLHDVLQRRGSPLLIFNPFPPTRWPPALRQQLHLVQWDRGTTPSAVLRTMIAE